MLHCEKRQAAGHPEAPECDCGGCQVLRLIFGAEAARDFHRVNYGRSGIADNEVVESGNRDVDVA